METEPTIVHGIQISSRRGEVSEMQQMENLANELHALSLAPLVVELFYDSKNSICEFKFKEKSPDFQSQKMLDIRQAAKKHLAQFDWGGYVEHGE